MRGSRLIGLLLLVSWAGNSRMMAEQSFESGPDRVSLLELYTSEGCSSCPPAEQWISRLRNDAALWRRVVPVVFHVSYWDSLGWRDPYASKEFTRRQHAYAAAWNSPQVYTPCFVRDGVEWRPGSPGVASPAAGSLRVLWSGHVAQVAFSPAESSGAYDAYVALVGSGLVSNVKSGENAGRTLRHDFVTLQWVKIALSREERGVFSGTAEISTRSAHEPEKHALAVWVTSRGTLAPLQATGGWIE